MPSFSNKKQLKFIVKLGTGKFGSSDNDTIIMEGFRATADVEKAGGEMMGTLKAKIYGVSQDNMNAITTLKWGPYRTIPTTVTVLAVDGEVETQVFVGNIINAWGDYQSMPDVFLQMQAFSTLVGHLAPAPPSSYKGSINVADAIQALAKAMGYDFENNNVNVQLSNHYTANTGMEQIRELARAAGIDLYADDTTIAICPHNAPRGIPVIPLVSPESGLVGYPTFDGVGINFRTLFNPGIKHGATIKLETSIPRAAGQWVVTSISHQLESEKPGGAWFSQVRGVTHDLAITG